MWYQTIPVCMGATGVFLLIFGIWAIVQWDRSGKLLSNIKEKINKHTL
jgi:hypothetical protein